MTSTERSTILVTGGAGYIGSHACVELLQHGYAVVVLDNLCNSSPRSLAAVQRITQKPLEFVQADVRDGDALTKLFARYPIDGVMHFAGHKAVAESVKDPAKYYDNNLNGTLRLIEAMQAAQCRKLVFSSSATVYGLPEQTPIAESAPTAPINPYGRSKLMVEEVLRDLAAADPRWAISILRYFNPVGAHASGEIGEDPRDVPNNLMPYITQVAIGKLPRLRVFGDDYATPDGTGIRDYIHVVDLAKGHIKALEYLAGHPGVATHNLGTGRGYSVLEALAAFERSAGVPIPYAIVERRPGDAAVSLADPSRAATELGWQAEFDLERMCADAWRWQSAHPRGYDD